jgi:chemotaxis protein methyltransferase CheR
MDQPVAEQKTFSNAGTMSSGISDPDFDRFSRLVHSTCGIKMPPQKRSMLEARLRKRLRSLSFRSFPEYAEYVFSPAGMKEELIHLIDVVTTNKTDFFREPAHFDFLTERVLPGLVEEGIGLERPMRVWSAGCATGEEPYTLGMVLNEFRKKVPEFTFSILATDISTRALEKGRLGVYGENKIGPIPPAWKRKYLLRSRDPDKRLFRIVPELRAPVVFRRLNFMEEDLGREGRFDVIFCRNVIIYFDRPTQENLLWRLCGCLSTGRFIFMGHSETLNGLRLPLQQVAPSVYRKR